MTPARLRARTEMVSITGYNPKGALNMVVVSPDSRASGLACVLEPLISIG
ncbi:hypothetical protein MAHJHV57_50380 [Mycobacterium avium subsp. hominissuis]